MSAGDPGHASGNQTYPEPSPDCICGHAELLHKLYAGKRTRCGVSDSQGRCVCLSYCPQETS